jgi:hypothetical protein
MDVLKGSKPERGRAKARALSAIHKLPAILRSRIWIIAVALLFSIIIILLAFISLPKIQGHSPSLPPEQHAAHSTNSAQSPAKRPLQYSRGSRGTSGLVNSAPQEEFNEDADPEELNKLVIKSGRVPFPQTRPSQEWPPDTARDSVPMQQYRKESDRSTMQSPSSAPSGRATSLHQAISKMNLTMLVYADAKAERLVYINGRKYAEGDCVDGNYIVESIAMDGAVLSFQGERMLLRARKN